MYKLSGLASINHVWLIWKCRDWFRRNCRHKEQKKSVCCHFSKCKQSIGQTRDIDIRRAEVTLKHKHSQQCRRLWRFGNNRVFYQTNKANQTHAHLQTYTNTLIHSHTKRSSSFSLSLSISFAILCDIYNETEHCWRARPRWKVTEEEKTIKKMLQFAHQCNANNWFSCDFVVARQRDERFSSMFYFLPLRALLTICGFVGNALTAIVVVKREREIEREWERKINDIESNTTHMTQRLIVSIFPRRYWHFWCWWLFRRSVSIATLF